MLWIRYLAGVVLAWMMLGTFGAPAEADSSRPNILLILLDDAGYSDLGCYGGQAETPHIDTFAGQALKLTDCHAAAPNCSPSRAGLLTGRIPSRIGIYSYIPPNHVMHLLDEEITLAEQLQAIGYRTGHFGKWHLSRLGSEQPQPRDQGFEYSLGTDNNASPSHLNPTNFVRNGLRLGKQNGYSCQIVTSETIRWLGSLQPQESFFACVWFHEPHSPIASPPDLVRKYRQRYPNLSPRQATYYANIENVDRAIGQLLNELDQLQRTQNTLVFITSDNGGVNPWSNQGLRGKKSLLYEGGHREPGLLRWPGKVQASTVDVPVSHLDFFPTISEICGIPLPGDRVYDGTSLAPLFAGKQLVRQEPLFWYFYRVKPAAALRQGDWILLGELDDPLEQHTHALTQPDMPMIKSAKLHRFELYNLKRDRKQQQDLAEQEPVVFERLKRLMIQKHAEVIASGPYWEL